MYVTLQRPPSRPSKSSPYSFPFQDKYKRALAESENIRRRLTKQIEDAKQFGIQGFCKDLLEVADILGHATEAVPKEEVRMSHYGWNTCTCL